MGIPLTAGDVVRPITGGPVMLVERIDGSGTDATVSATWREGETVKSATYPIGALVRVREPDFEIAIEDEPKRDRD